MSGDRALGDAAVRHYLSLPYRIALSRDGQDEERPWLATVEELPGCDARGSTAADAAGQIVDAIAEWVASARAEGREVPEPRSGRSHSGRLLLRMPQSLHSDLAYAAERDQVSLNAYLNVLRLAFASCCEGPSLELYFGATSGDVFGSGDAGATWATLATHLPQVNALTASG